MKKSAKFFMMSLLLALCLSFASCMGPGGATPTPGGGGEGRENLIYDSKTTLYLVYDPDEIAETTVVNIVDRFSDYGVYVETYGLTPTVKDHELVIGNVGREVSDSAYTQLGRLDKNSDSDLGYVIYSSGSSVALAYDEDYEGYALKCALDALFENFLGEELILRKGVAKKEAFDLYEYLEEVDALSYNEYWTQVGETAGAFGSDLVTALQTYYSIYDGEGLISWFANLFDPSICVCKGIYGEEECGNTQWCGTGGFYYSNSARDTYGFLPDAESTLQALSFIENCGITYGAGKSYEAFLPDWMGERIAAFAYSLQDSDGYFYHPQWGKDINVSRRGRDYNWCLNILNAYHVRPKYATIADAPTEDMVSATLLDGRLGSSSVSAVSRVIAVESETLIPDHLKTIEAFKEYLISLDVPNNSYSAGNTLSSQKSQIQARDAVSGGIYGKAVIEHLNACQRSNGIWHAETNYLGINGLMKISGVYNGFGAEIPNGETACRAAFAAVTSDEACGGIVDLWNAWEACSRVLGNIRSYGGGISEVDAIREELMPDMAEAILATREKLTTFRKIDGSFVYKYTGKTTGISMGASVCVPNTDEGDVNATVIGSTYMINSIFGCLGMSSIKVPLALSKERAIFLDIVNNLKPVDKSDDNIQVSDPVDFEYDSLGDTPADVTVSGNGNSMVVEDPRDPSGKVLLFEGVKGSGDSLIVNNSGPKRNTTGMVFESDICFLSEGTERYNGAVRLQMGKTGDDKNDVYRIKFNFTSAGVELWETSSNNASLAVTNFLTEIDYGEWLNLKIEYYVGDHETARIKVFLNGKLFSISDNYYDADGKKLSGTGVPGSNMLASCFYVLKDRNARMYVDNIRSYTVRSPYQYEPLHEDYRYDPSCVNVDAIEENGVIYDIEDIELGNNHPKAFTISGTSEVTSVDGDKMLRLSSGASAVIPAVKRTRIPNVSSVSFDILSTGLSEGTVAKLQLVEAAKTDGVITSLTLAAVRRDGDICIIVKDENGNEIQGVTIEVGAVTHLTVDFYEAEKVAILYVNGQKKGMCGVNNVSNLILGKINLSAKSDILIDDISVERGAKSFADATAPAYAGKVHDFTDGTGSVAVNGNGITTERVSGDNKLKFISSSVSPAYITVPVTARDDAMNYSELSFDILFSSTKKNGIVYKIAFTDGQGREIMSFGLSVNGSNIGILELTEIGEYPALYEFSAAEAHSIRFELYETRGICKVFVDGEYAFAGGLAYSKDNALLTPELVRISSGEVSATVYIDNLVFDRYSGVYLPEADQNRAEEEEVITFDYSADTIYPVGVGSSIYTGAPKSSIVEVERDGKGEKVLRFETYSNPNTTMDQISFSKVNPVDNGKSYVFEADLMIEKSTNDSLVQFYFWNGSKQIFEINIGNANGNVTFFHKNYKSGNKAEKIAGAEIGEWFNLRVEYYAVNGNSEIRVKVFINDELLYVTDLAYSGITAESLVTKASFNALKSAAGVIYLDNVSFRRSATEYDGSAITHTVK